MGAGVTQSVSVDEENCLTELYSVKCALYDTLKACEIWLLCVEAALYFMGFYSGVKRSVNNERCECCKTINMREGFFVAC